MAVCLLHTCTQREREREMLQPSSIERHIQSLVLGGGGGRGGVGGGGEGKINRRRRGLCVIHDTMSTVSARETQRKGVCARASTPPPHTPGHEYQRRETTLESTTPPPPPTVPSLAGEAETETEVSFGRGKDCVPALRCLCCSTFWILVGEAALNIILSEDRMSSASTSLVSYTHTHTHTHHIHAYVCVCVYIYIHTYIHTYIHKNIKHTNIHAYIHMYAHTHTNIDVCIYN
jgi:hypothetical protein